MPDRARVEKGGVVRILELKIERFRGLAEFAWQPAAGLNCLVGPGDAGKSTVLAAIALLLEPHAATPATEYDYYRRDVDAGFEIRAVLAGINEALEGERVPPLRGWRKGTLEALPEGDDPGVLEVLVRGTRDLEVDHLLIAPNGEERRFTVSMRRKMVLARLATGERAVGELRLGRGSLLDRVVGGNDVRGLVMDALATASSGLKLPDATEKSLAAVRARFAQHGLREDLSLGLLSPVGQSLAGMLNLVVGGDPAQAIPMSLAGLGSRQLALVALATQLMGDSPVIVADEPEAGLEPYRQRALIDLLRQLAGDAGQVFITTHSSPVLACLGDDELWRLTAGKSPLPVKGNGVDRVRAHNPEAFLSRLPLLCEGVTESGFLHVTFNSYARADGVLDIDALGILPVGMGGDSYTLDAAEQMVQAGWSLAVFVDNEERGSGRRKTVGALDGCCLGVWPDVRNIEEAVAQWLDWNRLASVIALSTGPYGDLNSRLQELGDAAARPGRKTLDELRELTNEADVRNALGVAMNKGRWFKTERAASQLAEHLLTTGGLPPRMDQVLREFWDRIRGALI